MEKKKLRPTHDHLLCRADAAETVTESGLLIPIVAQERRGEWATVLAAGPKALDCKEGDRILLTLGTMTDPVMVEGEKLYIVEEKLVQARERREGEVLDG